MSSWFVGYAWFACVPKRLLQGTLSDGELCSC